MSADRLQSSASQKNASSPIVSIENEDTMDATPSQPPMTPTKVTINVRGSQKSDPMKETGTPPAQNTAMLETRRDSPSKSPLESPKVLSVPSTPTSNPGSPEIQVAEVEDISDDPAMTRWMPFKHSASEARQIQENLLDSFPFVNTSKTLKKTLNSICAAIEKTFHFDNTDQTAHTPDPLTRFLGSWTTLALRMADIDNQTLIDNVADNNTTPDLLSDKYFYSLHHFLKLDQPFWKQLVDTRHYDLKFPVLAMLTKFTEHQKGLKCLTDTAKLMLDRLASLPSMIPKFQMHFWFVTQMATTYRHLLPELRAGLSRTLPSQFLDYFNVVDARLQNFITKQVSSLSFNVCQSLVQGLCNILVTVGSVDEIFARRLCVEKHLDIETLSSDETSDLLYLSWKFGTLKRCILEGRMEIRVQGAEIMQQDLVNHHRRYIDGKPGGSEHPISVFLADFLVQHKLVQYLVSAESHPQLIQRSSNILGYLVVTGRLCNADMDVVWNAAAANRESRSGEVIFNMLMPCLNLCTYSNLCYLVAKLAEISVDDFDAQMRRYADLLLKHLGHKWRENAQRQNLGLGEKLDMPPFDICLRFLRQSAPDGPYKPENAKAVHDWAKGHLMDLMRQGLSQDAKEAIFKECLDDIANPKLSATGSISAITALTSITWEHRPQHIRHLTRDLGMTDILIDDLCRTINEDRMGHVQAFVSQERLQTRLQLLYHVLLDNSETVSNDMATRLWEALVGSGSINEGARNTAWEMLISVARNSRTCNPCIDLCIVELLPKLKSRYMVPGCLAFAETIRPYIAQTDESRTPDTPLTGSTASELLWHLALTVPSERPDLAKKATDMLITLYLDSPDAHRRSREANDSVHIELVERCIDKLGVAASKLKSFNEGTSSGEDEPMVVVASDEEIQDQRLCFLRSLMILKEFVQGVRLRPMYSPSPELPPRLPVGFDELRGNPMKIKYQAHSEGKGASNMNTFEVGGLETIDELSQKLAALTRFSRFKAYAGGQELDFPSMGEQKLQDSGFLTAGLLLIRKVASAESASPLTGLRPMEVEVIRHFEQLYELLAMEDGLAHQESINTLSFTLIDLQVNVGAEACQVDLLVSVGLVDCLSSFLRAARDQQPYAVSDSKENQMPDTPSHREGDISLPNVSAFVDRCLTLLGKASAIPNSVEADRLAYGMLNILLEASLISHDCWLALQGSGKLGWIVQTLLLEERRSSSRQIIAKAIINVCRHVSEAPTYHEDIVASLTNAVLDGIPKTPEFCQNTQQFFDVTQALLELLGQERQQRLDSARYIQEWTMLLINHKHVEAVGRNEIDHFVAGLSHIIIFCLKLTKAFGTRFHASNNLLEQIFRRQLFPPLDDCDFMPNLRSSTRELVYDILLSLADDADTYRSLLRLVKEVSICGPESSQTWAWSHGYAQPIDDGSLGSNWAIEPSKTLRSAVGYPGLRNLSNTCYMNSLFTQLFMNTEFRDFILSVNIADGGTSQRLLHEIRTLFGFMQSSALKAIDTHSISESIVTYDNTAVDVTHQVDVDEFFNLLFDRLESQILNEEDKKKFRKFFGGHIVQQIKSKECSHISERLEPFSAIQCDISGKTNLAESLNAYIQGEAMEGDNKYSCTSCGKYVDAVKRACLKDIPDNIIFHLKRFDYDLIHGTRTKINDRFEFPLEVDMAPYHVDYLKEDAEQIESDVFALVGVLVHSGTAESGHYYSLIQERPSGNMQQKKWVEFNDMETSEFNPADIDNFSFGGWQDIPAYETRYAKLWNAYMLFYERVEKLLPTMAMAASPSSDRPLDISLPQELKNDVEMHNQISLRQHCLFDSSHAVFLRNLLKQLCVISNGKCSRKHDVEKEVIWLALEYLDKALARIKETSPFDAMLNDLIRTIGSCSVCCTVALEWVQENEYPLHDLLLRCLHPKVRKDFANMIILTLAKLREQSTADDDLLDDAADQSAMAHNQTIFAFPNILDGLMIRLRNLWGDIHTHSRGWDEYFGLLADVASMGAREAHLLLRLGFLQHCLELLICEHPASRHLRNQQPYMSYSKMVEKGKRFPFTKLIELVANLFERIDFTAEPFLGNYRDRPFHLTHMPMMDQEYQLIHFRQAGAKSICIFLEKILSTPANPPAIKRIIRTMVLAEPGARFHPLISNTIKSGINIDPANMAAPFLRAALVFCESTPHEAVAERMILDIASEVQTIGNAGGKEHLDFFAQARRLRSLRVTFGTQFFEGRVLTSMQSWAPHLLTYWEPEVRSGTIDLLKTLLFQHNLLDMDDEESAEVYRDAGRKLCRACTKRCQHMLEEGKPVGRIAEDVTRVITYCIDKYFSGDDDIFVRDAHDIMSRMEALAVTELDAEVSDWGNGSEDLPTDSDDETFGEV
ncbi:uncharacterized protein KY384_003111 [Bacidia gigantensis]|uniref:uncharacterized protein n=1 Tax=Bacidia gigantensis TaxID=2732470 RepID=UPI001D044E49|nr:uncharacterized protein KY384_003111 [Bacidia gigantensis]KAG8531482.1 hypothetical protein KY384_003111 [Bacidia gigantensis]